MKNCTDGSLVKLFDLLYELKYRLSFLEGHAFAFYFKLPSEHSYFSRTGMKALHLF